MAVSSIAVPPDPARDARAAQLVLTAPWPRVTLTRRQGAFPAGTVFYRVPSSKPDVRYVANGVCCTCPDAQQNDNVCKHIRAVVLFEASQQPAPAPKPRTALDRLNELYSPCAAGCGDLVERRGEKCYRCLSDEVYRQDRERREHVATA